MYAIRLARLSEAKRIVELEIAAGRAFRELDGYAWVDAYPAMAETEVAQAVENGGVWVVVCAGVVVGYALTYRQPNFCHLRELNVHPDHGRRGLGRRLVDHVVDEARQSGCDGVALTTFTDVPFNGPWYARLGFEVIDDDAQPSWLGVERDEERRRGLDRKPRQAMMLRLT